MNEQSPAEESSDEEGEAEQEEFALKVSPVAEFEPRKIGVKASSSMLLQPARRPRNRKALHLSKARAEFYLISSLIRLTTTTFLFNFKLQF